MLNVQLSEDVVRIQEIVVSEEKPRFAPINESVIVSSTEFSIDDVQRFAGSRMDPARMAQNFAGVLGANDTRNDIIIRGGSPIFQTFAVISYFSAENLLNHKNVLMRIWDANNQKEKIVYQLGIFPVGGFRIEF